jgi:hypothetical protein
MTLLSDKDKKRECIDRSMAASILGVSRRTMGRYVDRYNLQASEEKIDRAQIENLKQNISVCEDKELGSLTRQLFVLEKESITIHELVVCKYMDISKLNKALQTIDFYTDYYRKQGLQRFNLNPDEYFMPGEVLSRLRVSHGGVLGDLINDGSLESKVVHTEGKDWNFIPVNHFIEFMNSKGVKGRMLFITAEVSRITHISVNRIDKLAYRYELGIKLRQDKKSIYLFTTDEINALQELNGKPFGNASNARNSRNY